MKGEISMNKLMARIVAVVLAVMMLGTVSFADASMNDEKDTISGTADTTSRDVYTVKAFAAATADAEDGTIIALIQGTVPESIKVDPTRLASTDEYVIIVYGGAKDGVAQTLAKQVVQIPGEDVFTVNVLNEKEIGGVKYKGVAYATYKFSPAGKTVKEYGYKLTAFGPYAGKTLNGETVNYAKGTTTLSGTGGVVFDLVMLGVPAGVTVKAVPYIKY
jgi:hypothetical protein